MKKYLINDDDVIRVDKDICRIDSAFPFLHREKLFKEEKELVAHRIKKGIISEIWGLGDPLDPTPIKQGDLVANKHKPDIVFILISGQLIPLARARQALETYVKSNVPEVIKVPDYTSFEEFKDFESKTNN